MPSLVLQTAFLGDAVLTTPLIAHLASSGIVVDVLAIPAGATLLANDPGIREVIVYDKRGRDRGAAGFLRIARSLRERRYDAAYLCQGSVRSGALVWAARIPRRVGFERSAGRRFYTDRLPLHEHAHHAANLLSLATGDIDAAVHGPPPRLYPGEADRSAVDVFLSRHGWRGEPLIALAPGSIWGTKRWPGYPELASLIDDIGRIVVIGSRDEHARAAAIVEALPPGRVIDATGQFSLLGSAELIGRASAIVANDSAPLHIASAMNTPTIAIFGPTSSDYAGPLAERGLVVSHPALECRPCHPHGPQRCPLGHWRCMREISPRHVADVLRGILST